MDQAAKMNALVGSIIDDRYEIGAPIGAGAMGYVYRGRQRALEREVAIKVLSERHAQDPELVGRFKREAQAASAIGHPGIVQVFDFGTLSDGRAYLVMELVEGRSLGRILTEERALDVSRAVSLAIRICHILTAAHGRGIVHRDLKPDNLIVMDDERVRLIDFGIAKLLDVSLVLTKTNTMVGTPLYMAPEQWQGEGVDGRTDLYALGGILFEMIAGRPPFETDHLHTIITKHLTETPPTLSSLVPSVPPELSALVASCLAKARKDRPASAEALAGGLSRAMSTAVGYAATQATPQPFAAHPIRAPVAAPYAPNQGAPELPAAAPTNTLAQTELYQGRRVAAPSRPSRSWLPIALAVGGIGALLVSAGVVYAGLMFLSRGDTETVSSAPVAPFPSPPEPLPTSAPSPAPDPEPAAEPAPDPEPATAAAPAPEGVTAPHAVPSEEPSPEHPRAPAEARDPSRMTHGSTDDPTPARASRFYLETDPPGARVIDDSVRLPGATPMSIEVSEPRHITIALNGYNSEDLRIVPGGRARVRLTPEHGTAPAPPPPPPEEGPGLNMRLRGWDQN